MYTERDSVVSYLEISSSTILVTLPLSINSSSPRSHNLQTKNLLKIEEKRLPFIPRISTVPEVYREVPRGSSPVEYESYARRTPGRSLLFGLR